MEDNFSANGNNEKEVSNYWGITMTSQPKANWQDRSLEEISLVLKESMPEIKERYKVKSLGIFGSYLVMKKALKTHIGRRILSEVIPI